jgi:hypothetical protein
MSSRLMTKLSRYLLAGLLMGLVYQVGVPAREQDPEEIMPHEGSAALSQ